MTSLTTSILAKILASAVSQGIEISSNFLKSKLQGWLFDEPAIERLADKLKKMNLEDLNEKGIEKRLESDSEVNECISSIFHEQKNNTISQNHYGQGDNVGGNKVINYGRNDKSTS
ncbi:hypothetical protein [Pantoea sp. Fr-CA_6]|uniref:GapS6a family protein n=1 Tax=Pantoea sp. Fr-CA_6 TaxID=2929505 RepID=UPI00211869D1|nr:hypothetical protein [Pantoea sp. Fr-CA_6]